MFRVEFNSYTQLKLLTDDDGVVVRDEHLAVDIDELSDELPLQISVSPQTSDGDVVYPVISHCKQTPHSYNHICILAVWGF